MSAAPPTKLTQLPDDPSGRVLRLEGRQHSLHVALQSRNTDLAKMYVGALYALSQTDNPDRLALCAHGMRELMEKLPDRLKLSLPTIDQSLGDRVIALEAQWKTARKTAGCKVDGVWDGAVDARALPALNSVEEFLAIQSRVAPRRNDRFGAIIQQLEPSGRTLPVPVKDLRTKTWDESRDWFVTVAHHRGHAPTVEDFEARLARVEWFLIEQLKPQTVDDHRALKLLIVEAESS